MIGRRVQLKLSLARWYLDHPEIYGEGYRLSAKYETEMLMHLMCCMGVPMKGKVFRKGNDCWGVKFKIGNLKTWYYVDKKDLIWLR